MSENTTNNRNVRDDEIDLLDLFHRMGRAISKGVKALWTALLISIVFIIRRWLPLGLSILAGFGVAFLLNRTSTVSYTSDIVFRNNLAQFDRKKIKDVTGTTAEIISKVNSLGALCSDKDAFSEKLYLRPENVRSITNIRACWIIDRRKDGIADEIDYTNKHDIYDTINIRMPDRFGVQISFDSIVDLEKIRDGIYKFIENDSLNKLRNQLRQAQYRDMLARLNFDIRELDSLQKVKFFVETRNPVPGKDAQIVFMQNPNTQLLYPDIQSLYAKRQSLETEQFIYPGVVTMLRDFSAPSTVNSGTKYYTRKMVPIFFLSTLLILIILANQKKLIDIYKKY